MRGRTRIAAALLATLALGCARPITIETDRAALASIEVHNATSATMIVSYDAGAGRAVLGAIAPGATDHFIITAPAGTIVQVSGTNEAGTITSGPYAVTLQAGTSQRVTLR